MNVDQKNDQNLPSFPPSNWDSRPHILKQIFPWSWGNQSICWLCPIDTPASTRGFGADMKRILGLLIEYWLVVWNMNFIFPYIGNNNPNWRTHIFQRVRSTTNQEKIWKYRRWLVISFGLIHHLGNLLKGSPDCFCWFLQTVWTNPIVDDIHYLPSGYLT